MDLRYERGYKANCVSSSNYVMGISFQIIDKHIKCLYLIMK